MDPTTIIRNEDEIWQQVHAAEEVEFGERQTRYRGMSYEQGMVAMYRWLTDPDVEFPPIEEADL